MTTRDVFFVVVFLLAIATQPANASQLIVLGGFHQFKSDVTTPVNEGGTTTEDAVVFGATLQSSSTNPLRLEVEYMTGAFTGTANATSR